MIRILHPGDEGALEVFLLPRLDSSMLLLNNLRAAGLQDTGRRYEGTYAAAFEGEAIHGVVAHFWNGNLILQANHHLDALWRAAVEASGRLIAGLIGPADQVGAVMEVLPGGAAQIQLDETEYLYRLSLQALAEPEALHEGQVRGRRMEHRDLDLATDWSMAYAVESLGDAYTPQVRARSRASMEHLISEERAWILEDEAGTPVAQSAFNAVAAGTVQIGGVWTPPALRGRGYGRAVVAASLQAARAEGKERAILFTGVRNIPAQRGYEALGFRRIGDYRIVLLREPIAVVPGALGRSG